MTEETITGLFFLFDNILRAWKNNITMFRSKNVLLLGSFGLIVLAIGLVAILENTSSPTTSSGDVRARAASIKTLNVNATVASIDVARGTITVGDVYLASDSRSGDPKNLGAWVVTIPSNFTINSVHAADNLIIGVDPTTFLATKHTMTALSITPGVR